MPGTDDTVKYNTAQAFRARAATHRALELLCDHRAAAHELALEELTRGWAELYQGVAYVAHEHIDDDGQFSVDGDDAVTAEEVADSWTAQLDELAAYRQRWDDTEVEEEHRVAFEQARGLLTQVHIVLDTARNCVRAAFASAAHEEEGDGTDTDEPPTDDQGTGEGPAEEEGHGGEPEPGDPANPGDIVERRDE